MSNKYTLTPEKSLRDYAVDFVDCCLLATRPDSQITPGEYQRLMRLVGQAEKIEIETNEAELCLRIKL